MTKDEEKYVIESFKKLYSDFPLGSLIAEKEPLPDFVLTAINGETIGIEITEAVISQEEMKYASFRHKVTNLILDKLSPILPFTFDISVTPYKNKKIAKAKLDPLINEVVNICVEEAVGLRNLELIRLENFENDIKTYPLHTQAMILSYGFRNLPFGIKTIRIGRYDAVGKSWNSYAGNMVVPDFTEEALSKILKAKHACLEKYEKCNKYWLIIWERGIESSYYNDIQIESIVKSKFDKVFLVRTSSQRVVVFKS